jgi:NhaA family Na+:H+ antiporter
MPTDLTIPIDPSRDHTLGPPDAPVTLLEYGDYECPGCGRAYPMLKTLNQRFVGKLRFAFRHFPLYTVHSHASQAAQAAEAAAAQGKFWQMHDLLYQNQKGLEPPDLTHYALRAGLEVYKFDAMLGSGALAQRVESDYASGVASGVTGTPTLFINAVRYCGPVELEPLAAAIERLIPMTT